MLKIKIQSSSDLITNSSSEVFIVKSNGISFNEIKELIEAGAEARYEAYNKEWETNCRKNWKQLEEEDLDGCSGMGGELDVWGWKEMYNNRKEWNPDYTIEEFASDEGLEVDNLDQYVWIDIDWARRGTINFIYDNFEVIDNDLS